MADKQTIARKASQQRDSTFYQIENLSRLYNEDNKPSNDEFHFEIENAKINNNNNVININISKLYMYIIIILIIVTILAHIKYYLHNCLS